MGKYLAFPQAKESDVCPAIPHSVRVWGDAKEGKTKQHGGDAFNKLKKALKDDPKLEKDHPEFLSPDDKKKSPSTKK